MTEVLIYNTTTYHLTDGRKSLFSGAWEVSKSGVYVEYPSEHILPLSNREKIKIKRTIIDFYRDWKSGGRYSGANHLQVELCGAKKTAKPVMLRFNHLEEAGGKSSKESSRADCYVI